MYNIYNIYNIYKYNMIIYIKLYYYMMVYHQEYILCLLK